MHLQPNFSDFLNISHRAALSRDTAVRLGSKFGIVVKKQTTYTHKKKKKQKTQTVLSSITAKARKHK